MEKHQYGFAIMNTRTGGCTRKSFWGRGSSEEECRRDAFVMAKAYAEQKTDVAYRKACMRDRSGYRPSRSSYEFEVVGCTLWK